MVVIGEEGGGEEGVESLVPEPPDELKPMLFVGPGGRVGRSNFSLSSLVRARASLARHSGMRDCVSVVVKKRSQFFGTRRRCFVKRDRGFSPKIAFLS